MIMCAGRKSKAKGKKGSWITLAEWVKDEEKKDAMCRICVKTERVDGEKIKDDTYYNAEKRRIFGGRRMKHYEYAGMDVSTEKKCRGRRKMLYRSSTPVSGI